MTDRIATPPASSTATSSPTTSSTIARRIIDRRSRAAELIALLTEHDMHGLECAWTVELESISHENARDGLALAEAVNASAADLRATPEPPGPVPAIEGLVDAVVSAATTYGFGLGQHALRGGDKADRERGLDEAQAVRTAKDALLAAITAHVAEARAEGFRAGWEARGGVGGRGFDEALAAYLARGTR